MPTQKRIGFYYAGGLVSGFPSQAALQRWADEFVELQMVASASATLIVDGRRPVRLSDLKKLARSLQRDWKKRDGFIICFGRSRLLYHANLLATMLGPVGKPVIVTTGSPDPVAGDYSDLGLRANLVNGALAALADFRGVVVIDGPELISVDRAMQTADGSIVTTNGAVGRIDFGIVLDRSAEPRTAGVPTIQANCAAVAYVEVDGARPVLPGLPRRLPGLIVDGGHTLSLAVTRQLPKGTPALLLSADAAHLVQRGQISEIDGVTPAAAAARFTCRLKAAAGNGGRITPDEISRRP
jgi:hypothetical protein